MRARLLLAVPALLALVGGAQAVPRQFDLICKGEAQVVNEQSGKDETVPSTDRIGVDLDRQMFCLEGCWHLGEADETHIAYHYTPEVADRDHPANSYRAVTGSSAGPFEQQEDLTVDLRTGAFARTYVFDFGDIVSVRHTSRSKGRCEIAPFTPWQK